MKIILLKLIILFSFVPSLMAQDLQQNFSKAEVIADMDYLYESLIDAHYDIYAYTSEASFKENYLMEKKKITGDSLDLLTTTNILQRIASAANNGHTNIGFPIQPYMNYAQSGGTLFPLEIALEGEQFLVRKNWSSRNDIVPGSEIISINEVEIQNILDRIYPQISAERRYFKHVKLELFSFPRYYWQVFGEVKTFDVKIKEKGKIKNYTLDAVEVIDGYETKRSEVLNAKMQLKFFQSAAYLNPGHFSGDETDYQSFVDSAFVAIQEQQYDHLIVDLRNNSGGDDAFSDYLVAYFADKPFLWCSSLTLKTSDFLKDFVRQNHDTTTTYWSNVLTHKSETVYTYEFDPYQPQPQEKRFTGKVYVLINRQSHSQAAVTASQIQDYGFGTIVGEETGDYPSLYASIFHYSLPNTGISVSASKGQIIRVNGSTNKEGVIPDIYIKDYLLDERDEILEGILERLEK